MDVGLVASEEDLWHGEKLTAMQKSENESDVRAKVKSHTPGSYCRACDLV